MTSPGIFDVTIEEVRRRVELVRQLSINSADGTEVWEALLSFNAGQISVAAKIGSTGRSEGNHVAAEAQFYETLARDPSRSGSLTIPTYYGQGKLSDGRTIFFMARSAGDLGRVLRVGWSSMLPAEGRQRIVGALATVVAHDVLSTLLLLSRFSKEERVAFLAHRDIKLENIHVYRPPNGQFRFALADFAWLYVPGSHGRVIAAVAAPEQKDGTPSSLETDLWAVGVSLWRLLHDDRTPYRDHGMTLTWDQLALRGGRTLDFSNESETWNNAHPAYRLAQSLLVKSSIGGNRRGSAAAAWLKGIDKEVIAARQILHQEQASLLRAADDGLGPGVPLGTAARAYKEDAQARQSVPLRSPSAKPAMERALRAVRGIGAGASRVARFVGTVLWRVGVFLGAVTARVAGFFFRYVALDLLLAAGTAAIVAGAALLAGWSQVMPLPNPQIDLVLRQVVAGALAVIGLVSLCAVVGIRVHTPRRRRMTIRWFWPLVSGVLCMVALGFGVSTVAREPLDDTSTLALIGAASAVTALLEGRNPFRWRRFSKTAQDSAVRRHLEESGSRPVFTVVVAVLGAAAVVICIAVPSTPQRLANHALVASVVAAVPGTPGDEPVLINPHGITVNSRGDVVVVDRVGVDRDTVWLFPADGSRGRQLLATSNWSSPRGSEVIDVPEAITLEPLPAALTQYVNVDDGDPVTSVDALDFLDDDTIVLLGKDGLTMLDLLPEGEEVRTTRVTTAVSAKSPGDQIRTDGRRAYIVTKGEVQAALPKRYCEFSNEVGSAEVLWMVDLAMDTPKVDWVSSGDLADPCADWVAAVIDSGATVEVAVERREAGVDQYWAVPLVETDGRMHLSTEGLNYLDHDPESTTIHSIARSGSLYVANVDYCLGSYDAADASKGAVPARPYSSKPCGEWTTAEAGGEPVADADACASTDVFSAGDQWQPIAAGGPSGAITFPALPAVNCTPVIRSAGPDGAVSSAPGPSSQLADGFALGETAIMSASRPSALRDGGWAWHSPAIGRVQTDTTGTWRIPARDDLQFSNQPVKLILLADGTQIWIGARSPEESTRLIVTRADSVTLQFEVDGLTDSLVSGDRIWLGRCGQIMSVDSARFAAITDQPDERGLLPFSLLEATVEVGVADPGAACANPVNRPTASSTGLGVEMLPVAFTLTGKNQRYIVYVESGRFAEDVVSRVRVADREASRVTTVGYDREDDSHQAESNDYTGALLLGDIGRLGLAPTDVATDENGRIAVSTATAEGTGPLLLFSNDRIDTVVIDGAPQITGVASGSDGFFGVTDGSRGDFLVLDISAAADNTGVVTQEGDAD